MEITKIELIIEDFLKVYKLAIDNDILSKNEIEIEIFTAGQKHVPNKLPKGKMAVYIFIAKDQSICYKVGKVGVNSNARYQSQHYNPDSSKSNLAKSLLDDYDINDKFNGDNIADWIKTNTTRINLLLPANKSVFILNLLEAFLQIRFQPKYEGYKSQKPRNS